MTSDIPLSPVGVIRDNVVPMLSAPARDAEMVSQALYGETVQVLGRSEGFAHIRGADGYEGWVSESAVVAVHDGWNAGLEVWTVQALLEPLYVGELSRLRQRTLLTMGTVVHVVPRGDAGGAWAQVMVPDGERAYIRRAAMEPWHAPSGLPRPETLLEYALKFVGVPYLWGGRSPFGFDCSGFTQRVYGLFGVVIPRDAYQQASWAGFERVPADAIAPGDLLFFRGKEDPRGRGITHVGMALDPPWFIHAAGGSGVCIASLQAEEAGRNLSHGGRLIPR